MGSLSENEKRFLDVSANGNLEEVKRLYREGIDVNCSTDKGYTALTLATCEGHVEVVNYLLDKGVDIEVENDDKWTPLFAAAIETAACPSECFQIMKLLLKNGANPHHLDSRNQTFKDHILGYLNKKDFDEINDLVAGYNLEIKPAKK